MKSTYILILLIGLSLVVCSQNDKKYEDILHRHEENEGMIGIELKDGRVGFEDTKGNLVIPFKFYKIGPAWDDKSEWNISIYFKEGLAAVKNGEGKAGYINKLGEWVIKPIYRSANHFGGGIAGVYIDVNNETKFQYINKYGEIVFGPFSDDKYLFFYFYPEEKHGLFRSKANGKYGIVNQYGKETVPPIYDKIPNISEQRTFATIGNKTRIIDMNNNVILNDVEGRHYIFGTSIIGKRINGEVYFAIVDKEGNFLLNYTNEVYFNMDHPCEELYFPYPHLIDCSFGSFHPVVDGVVAAISTKTNRYGIYSVKGRWVVEPIYRQIEYKGRGLFAYRTTDNQYGLFNTKGEKIEVKR